MKSQFTEYYTSGQVEIKEKKHPLRDVKLFSSRCKKWNWTKPGIHHNQGIQTTDIWEILNNGSATLVLSNGVYNSLKISSETVQLLLNKISPAIF